MTLSVYTSLFSFSKKIFPLRVDDYRKSTLKTFSAHLAGKLITP